jgi:hypothetical protein
VFDVEKSIAQANEMFNAMVERVGGEAQPPRVHRVPLD